MTPSELAKDIGKHHLVVWNTLKRVAPDRKDGPLTDVEIDLIRKELKVITAPERKRARGFYGDSRYPGFIEATDIEGTEKITVQIPPNIEPEMFIGREFWVEQREYAPNRYVFEYNPYKQDD